MEDRRNKGFSEIELKIVILGGLGVGKTCIINRFLSDSFSTNEQTTVGAMYHAKDIIHNDVNYKLQIWDTAGQERFKTIAPLYYKDAHCVLQVCDVTEPRSLEALKDWAREQDEKGPENVVSCIVGNKIDLKDEIEISEEVLKDFANTRKGKAVMASAYTGYGIDQVFQTVIDLYNKLAVPKKGIRPRGTSKLKQSMCADYVDPNQQGGCKC